MVELIPGISPFQLATGKFTIALTGLDNTDNRPNIVDIRWRRKHDAIKAVAAMYEIYLQLEYSPDI